VMFRRRGGGVEFFLVHPGGPFWRKKDMGTWSIPKGEYTEEEEPLEAAKREFQEETGIVPRGDFVSLGEIKQPGGKVITAWAFEGDGEPREISSNTFSMEWPPKSGQMHEFPEVDRADWFSLDAAGKRILKGQVGFLERCVAHIAGSTGDSIDRAT
jgi:predicted NUDIX family NTP pyrophosphohydrolase